MNSKKYSVFITALFSVFIGGLFILLTFLPPHIPLFRDPLTQSYGYQRNA